MIMMIMMIILMSSLPAAISLNFNVWKYKTSSFSSFIVSCPCSSTFPFLPRLLPSACSCRRCWICWRRVRRTSLSTPSSTQPARWTSNTSVQPSHLAKAAVSPHTHSHTQTHKLSCDLDMKIPSSGKTIFHHLKLNAGKKNVFVGVFWDVTVTQSPVIWTFFSFCFSLSFVLLKGDET